MTVGEEVVVSIYPCPSCGTPTDWSFDCPGYPGDWGGKPTVMVCYPTSSCGGAIYFECDECSWWYRTPNSRKAEGMASEPPTWLPNWKQEFKEIYE